MEDAEELDTREEPLLRREPLIERMDLESASSSLQEEAIDKVGRLKLHLIISNGKDMIRRYSICLIQCGKHRL